MKVIAKILATLVTAGVAWIFQSFLFMALNQPHTVLVILGVLGVVISLYLWWVVVDYLWSLESRLAVAYSKIKEKIYE